MYDTGKYKDCCRCDLCKTRRHVVQYTLWNSDSLKDTDVLWIGEAPGPMENILGIPFCGDAGRIMSLLLDDVHRYHKKHHAITNVVCCIPYNNIHNRDFRAPREEEINACAPRLNDFIDNCDPNLIVLLGKVARGHVLRLIEEHQINVRCPMVAVTHPSYMNRGMTHQGSQAFNEAVAVVRTVLDRMMNYPYNVAEVVLD